MLNVNPVVVQLNFKGLLSRSDEVICMSVTVVITTPLILTAVQSSKYRVPSLYMETVLINIAS